LRDIRNFTKVVENSGMSKFQSGQTKPEGSGRRAGTPNRTTRVLKDILDSKGVDPAEALCDLLPKLSAKEQSHVLLELLSYVYPRRKAVDAESVDLEQPLLSSFSDVMRELAVLEKQEKSREVT